MGHASFTRIGIGLGSRRDTRRLDDALERARQRRTSERPVVADDTPASVTLAEGTGRPIPLGSGEDLDTAEPNTHQAPPPATHKQLLWEAERDSLTGLPNRAYLLARLRTTPSDDGDLASDALLVLQVNNFELFTDAMGHDAGDRLLMELAARLNGLVRSGDTVTRLGRDEFGVLLAASLWPGHADALAGSIQAAMAAPVELVDHRVSVTVSVGVALGADNDRTELLAAAETALKLAKERGRDRTEVFGPSLRADAHRRVETEHSLRHAIDAGEMIVRYQPVLDLATERVVGAEALLRIRDADGRAHLPTHLIAVAEETGLIVPIGAMVIEQACRQMRDWRRELGPLAPVKVAVNVAPRQWASPGLTATVERSLREYGLESGALCLEITESSQIATDEVVTENMRALRVLGVQLALGDFGAGHAGLNYLTRFEADCVKIDKGFVDDIVTNRSQEIIVRGVVDMATSLGMVVIAEGVEKTDQRDVLCRLGCHQGQGWLWHKAVSGAEFTEYVRGLAASTAPGDSAEHDGTAGAV